MQEQLWTKCEFVGGPPKGWISWKHFLNHHTISDVVVMSRETYSETGGLKTTPSIPKQPVTIEGCVFTGCTEREI